MLLQTLLLLPSLVTGFFKDGAASAPFAACSKGQSYIYD
jgi:hypothetical protein